MKKRILFTTVLNNSYFFGFIALIESILIYNPNFNHPFKIYYSKEISPLDIENINKIKSKYNFVTFHDVDLRKYKYCFETFIHYCHIQPSFPHNERLKPAFLALESFSENKYDQVCFLDTDMLVTGDLSPIWKNNRNGFWACEGTPLRSPTGFTLDKRGYKLINSGIFIIGKDLLGYSILHKILNYQIKLNDIRKFGNLADQTLLNAFFAEKTNLLEPVYNTRFAIDDLKINLTKLILNLGIKIIHYSSMGIKPWEFGILSVEKSYPKLRRRNDKSMRMFWRKLFFKSADMDIIMDYIQH
tara:strand:+ start:427 stop:1326 length:900 start_codon:yes stop_codon:yes gene_type:complete